MKNYFTFIPHNLFKGLENFYAARNLREKKLLKVAVMIIFCAIFISTAIAPAAQMLITKPQELQTKRIQVAQALKLAEEITALQNHTRTIRQPNLEATIHASLAPFSWQGQSEIKQINNAQIEVKLKNLPAVDALTWIDENERTHGLTLTQLELIKVSTGVVNLHTVWTAPQ